LDFAGLAGFTGFAGFRWNCEPQRRENWGESHGSTVTFFATTGNCGRRKVYVLCTSGKAHTPPLFLSSPQSSQSSQSSQSAAPSIHLSFSGSLPSPDSRTLPAIALRAAVPGSRLRFATSHLFISFVPNRRHSSGSSTRPPKREHPAQNISRTREPEILPPQVHPSPCRHRHWHFIALSIPVRAP
jgi:hypothetical protein